MIKLLLTFASLFISATALSEVVSFGEKNEKINEQVKIFSCESFSIYQISRSLESEYFARATKLTLGLVQDNSVILKKNIIVKGNTLNILPNIAALHSDHEKIDPNRIYTDKPKSCLADNQILFSLYSGGNCSTVCEAWAILEFDDQAKLVNSEILNYQQYKKLIEK